MTYTTYYVAINRKSTAFHPNYALNLLWLNTYKTTGERSKKKVNDALDDEEYCKARPNY